mmetsp:Transcript_51911/g.95981  ORF Transcript_51911/g.95981 Transcript_51911/m.95981 type:complete len:205 (-) Transcript_51911:124-738(-)
MCLPGKHRPKTLGLLDKHPHIGRVRSPHTPQCKVSISATWSQAITTAILLSSGQCRLQAISSMLHLWPRLGSGHSLLIRKLSVAKLLLGTLWVAMGRIAPMMPPNHLRVPQTCMRSCARWMLRSRAFLQGTFHPPACPFHLPKAEARQPPRQPAPAVRAAPKGQRLSKHRLDARRKQHTSYCGDIIQICLLLHLLVVLNGHQLT